MANRFFNPNIQYLDASGEMLSGGLLYFYVTGTTTPTNTYTTNALSVANANPVVLSSAGRAGDIFLDPAVTYKVVLKTSAGVTIWTADPVVDPAANVTASFQVYAGNPNGNVAGNAGSVGGVGASVVWDITNHLLYVCTTSGVAAAAVWTVVGASLAGQITQTGVITPTTLAANTDNWAPTGLSAASVIRMAASTPGFNLTGITAQPDGALLTLENIGAFPITLMDDVTSTAANRFQFPANVVVEADDAIAIRYDATSSRWRSATKLNVGNLRPPGGRLSLTTGVAVHAADVASATTIYYTPRWGFFAPLYNGAATVMVNLVSELSIALDNDSGHTGYHQSGKNFDLFIYDDAGTIRLISGPAWTTDTARGTALEFKNGFLCNAASMTAKYDASAATVTVAQDRGLYVGSVRMSANGTTKWVANPAAAAGGGDCQLMLWNMYNRAVVDSVSRDNTNSWTYTTATLRAANEAVSSGLLNRISVLVGLNEEAVNASYSAIASNSASLTFGIAAVGVDSITAASGTPGTDIIPVTSAAAGMLRGEYNGYIGLGWHFVQALEYAAASGTTTWYGDNGGALYQMALRLRTMM